MNRRTTKTKEEVKVSSSTLLIGDQSKLYLPENNHQISALELKGSFFDCIFENLYVKDLNGFEVCFENCIFVNCRFQHSTFESAKFSNCRFESVRIKDANLSKAEFEKTSLRNSRLENIKNADKLTLKNFKVDRKTKISIADLNDELIDKQSLQSIKRNQRRHNLMDSESNSLPTKIIARIFFLISDYGTSTYRVVAVTLAMILLFQRVYLLPYYLNWEPLIPKLVDKSTPESLALVEIRALYFTVLTTAGVSFGDLIPAPTIYAYLIVTSQIIVSYVLLAAVIFRLAGFFQD